MAERPVLSTRAVAGLLARIFGPSIHDVPLFNGGDPVLHPFDQFYGPSPVPWRAGMLNPQPLPPRERYSLMLGDAHIIDLLNHDRLIIVVGGDSSGRLMERALKSVQEIDELCPRWPRWPRVWPPGPPPPGTQEEMTATELFLFGTRLLAGSELFEQGKLKQALAGLGDKVLGMSMKGMA